MIKVGRCGRALVPSLFLPLALISGTSCTPLGKPPFLTNMFGSTVIAIGQSSEGRIWAEPWPACSTQSIQPAGEKAVAVRYSFLSQMTDGRILLSLDAAQIAELARTQVAEFTKAQKEHSTAGYWTVDGAGVHHVPEKPEACEAGPQAAPRGSG